MAESLIGIFYLFSQLKNPTANYHLNLFSYLTICIIEWIFWQENDKIDIEHFNILALKQFNIEILKVISHPQSVIKYILTSMTNDF